MPERLLARVRKLLALAESPNVHEAALAAAQAQALIDRHHLSELLAEVDAEPITDGRQAPLEAVKRPRRWRSILAAALAEANGCLAWQAESGGLTALYILGRDRDRAVVAALFEGLARQIEWLSATHAPGARREVHDAFRIGAVEAIGDRLRSPRPADAEPGLVRVDLDRVARRAAVEAFAQQHLRLGKGRALRLDGRAYAAGKAAGGSLGLPVTEGALRRGR